MTERLSLGGLKHTNTLSESHTPISLMRELCLVGRARQSRGRAPGPVSARVMAEVARPSSD